MGSVQEWWSHKEAEMQRQEEARERRWQAYQAEHPGADLEALRAEFQKAEAVLFVLEQGPR